MNDVNECVESRIRDRSTYQITANFFFVILVAFVRYELGVAIDLVTEFRIELAGLALASFLAFVCLLDICLVNGNVAAVN